MKRDMAQKKVAAGKKSAAEFERSLAAYETGVNDTLRQVRNIWTDSGKPAGPCVPSFAPALGSVPSDFGGGYGGYSEHSGPMPNVVRSNRNEEARVSSEEPKPTKAREGRSILTYLTEYSIPIILIVISVAIIAWAFGAFDKSFKSFNWESDQVEYGIESSVPVSESPPIKIIPEAQPTEEAAATTTTLTSPAVQDLTSIDPDASMDPDRGVSIVGKKPSRDEAMRQCMVHLADQARCEDSVNYMYETE